MMRMAFTLFLGLAAWGLFGGGEAKASFGDCFDAAYIASFDGRPATDSFTCVEHMRVNVNTPAGTRSIRIIHDAAFDWAAQPGTLENAARGVRAAADALPELGAYRMDDITVLLLDSTPPHDPSAGTHGEVAGETGATPGQECRMVFYLLGRGGDPGLIANNVAHEIFHCIQFASLTREQMTSGAGGTGNSGDWWIEGSAAWFAAFAIGETPLLPDRTAEFEEQVEAGVALNDMDYGAAVFFMWLGGAERGPTGILPFLQQMASRSAASAQRAAMRSALPDDAWLRFVQDYLDFQIKHPNGSALPFAIAEGTVWSWDASRAQEIELALFTITRGRLHFECGTWRIEARPGSVNYATRPMEGRSWAPLPAEINTEEGDEADYRFGAISTRDRPQTLTVDAERRESCAPCGGSDEIDRCLVGAWEQTGGGAQEWLRSQLPPNVNMPVAEQSGGAIVMKDDGTYWTAPMNQRTVMLIKERDGISRADGEGIAQGSGRWSVSGGSLSLCQDAGGMTGNAQVTTPDVSFNMPLAAPSAGSQIAMRYSCSERSFSTEMEVPGAAAMRTDYSKIAD